MYISHQNIFQSKHCNSVVFKYTVRRVWFFQRGQKNVRNHTQVKLAATSLECKQAGTFQYTSVCVGGRFRLITRIREKN